MTDRHGITLAQAAAAGDYGWFSYAYAWRFS
jgi:hypothetical protein